jgi:hypothetical protein
MHPQPLEKLSVEEAWENFGTRNSRSKWAQVAPELRSGVFLPEFDVPFELRPTDAVFCSGSCFAKNIERFLGEFGVAIRSREIAPINGTRYLNTLPNLFNVHSVLNEIEWALSPDTPFPEGAFVENENGDIYDPHCDPGLLQCSREIAGLRRQSITRTMQRIAECRVVIITLGLVEAWYDHKISRYLNTPLPLWLMDREQGRFELHVLSASSVLDALDKLRTTVKTYGCPDVQLVLTVSPVPLKATFTRADVVVANTHSKAILLAATGEFASRHDDVHYIPTYESILHSSRLLAWRPDLRHVTDEFIELNVARFLSKCLADGQKSRQATTQLRGTLARILPKQPAVAAPPAAPFAAEVPRFWQSKPGDAHFPAGFPAISESSVMSTEFDARGLMSGVRRIWHARSPAQFPEFLQFEFPKSLECGALWIQAQEADRSPSSFRLEATSDGLSWTKLLEVKKAKWKGADQWQCWPVNSLGAWRSYRLVILANGGHPTLLTIKKLWIAPRVGRLSA